MFKSSVTLGHYLAAQRFFSRGPSSPEYLVGQNDYHEDDDTQYNVKVMTVMRGVVKGGVDGSIDRDEDDCDHQSKTLDFV